MKDSLQDTPQVSMAAPPDSSIPDYNDEAWEPIHRETARSFAKLTKGSIAVKKIEYLGDEVMKVFRIL